MAQDRKSRMRGRLDLLIVALVYIPLTLLATYPAIRTVTLYPIGGGDSLQNMWNLWWVKWALSHGHLDLYHATMVYHPGGVSLAYHTLVPLKGLLAYPLLRVFGLDVVGAFNVVAMLSFVASGLSMYLLARELVDSHLAAFVASLVFVFSPMRMSRVLFGNLNLYSTEFVPLAFWFLVKMRRTRRYGYAIGAGAALALTAWCSLELAFFAGFVAALLMIFDLFSGERRLARTKRWILCGAVTAVLALPVVWPMLRDHTDFADQADQTVSQRANSADLVGFFVPDRVTAPVIKRVGPPRVARWIERTYDGFYGNPCEKSVFLGYTVLVIVILTALLVRARAMREWLIIAGLILLFSLGPVLYVAGRPSIPMPYNLFSLPPIVRFGRTPSRFALLLMLALAVVVGYGLDALQRRKRGFQWIVIALGVLIYAEFLTVPFYLDKRPAAVPQVYYELKDAEPGAILDVPMDLYGAQGPGGEYMLYQTVHGHAIVGGYISRTPAKALYPLDYPFLNALRVRIYGDREPYQFIPEALEHWREDLAVLDVRYVILHRDFLSEKDFDVCRGALGKLLATPIHEDAHVTIWFLAE